MDENENEIENVNELDDIEEPKSKSSIVWFIIYIVLLVVFFSLLTTVLSQSGENRNSIWTLYALGLVLSLVGCIMIWKIKSLSKWVVVLISTIGFTQSYIPLFIVRLPETSRHLMMATHAFGILTYIMSVINVLLY